MRKKNTKFRRFPPAKKKRADSAVPLCRKAETFIESLCLQASFDSSPRRAIDDRKKNTGSKA